MIPFARYSARVEEHLVHSRGLCVTTRDIPDPLTGDLDGSEIQIDFAVTPEQRLFLLAHLFGHTVQWNIDPRALELGKQHEPPVDPELLASVIDYEREAARYALGLLHDIGITDLDQWMSDYSACDTAYLSHYYRTGEKQDFLSFWRQGTEVIQPLPVPPFTPRKRRFRCDGIVI